jgi:demethylmenaquinone methyltransferase / 2-methoxy-6-polyprenyl-1,4-benzoquinol methylase
MGAVLSFGQDARWRRAMISRVNAIPGSWTADVASGTGLVARELAASKQVRVVAIDQSEVMLRAGLGVPGTGRRGGSVVPVLGQAEELPFLDETFDSVTFTYLLRYVEDPGATLAELARVLRRGGALACVEFHVPDDALPRLGWTLYTRLGLSAIGALVSPAWRHTGMFLGANVSAFYRRYPLAEQVGLWQRAGLHHVRTRRMSLGAGIVISGLKGSEPQANDPGGRRDGSEGMHEPT